jgi:oligopeptide/dipeptide ABC transporter ATP-binding protein
MRKGRLRMLAARQVTRTFAGRDGSRIYAVERVDLSVKEGETLGLIGESGSGKSTLGRLLTRMLDPDSGTVTFGGIDLTALGRGEVRKLRGDFQIVFQEPFASLNPRMTIGEIVEEPLIAARGVKSKAERHARVDAMLREVGLGPEHWHRRPADLSGGQQQRVGIARALISSPRMVVLDEPTSSLDVTSRVAILKLLADLQRKHALTFLFISHDVHTVRRLSSRIAVMYLGRIVEIGRTQDVLERPEHPYTRALLSAALSLTPGAPLPHLPLGGEPPKPAGLRIGCPLFGRCPIAITACATTPIELRPTGVDHSVACIRPGAVA